MRNYAGDYSLVFANKLWLEKAGQKTLKRSLCVTLSKSVETKSGLSAALLATGDQHSSIIQLQRFLNRYPRLVVITGAGCSTSSGIPAYRDASGVWQRSQPIQHKEFIELPAARRRYWARSLIGWQYVQQAEPNSVHYQLADWESAGRIELLITQNVDGLHQRAGSRNIVNLHGCLEDVFCLSCGLKDSRALVQRQLAQHNPELVNYVATVAPDGDADVDSLNLERVITPVCSACGGDLMPDVVFFGGTVPKQRVILGMQAIQDADAVVVLGSSLMVYSGFRFCKEAARIGKPIAAVNRGITRADDLLDCKVWDECGSVLQTLTI